MGSLTFSLHSVSSAQNRAWWRYLKTTKARVRLPPLTEPLPGLGTLGWSVLDRLVTLTGVGSHVDNGGISRLTQGEAS